MKIKNLAYIAPISILILGGGVLGFIQIHKKAVIPNPSRQHHQAAPHNKPSFSISKSTILILLAMGIVGVLSVRRKKNSKGNPAQHEKLQAASDDRDKAFVELNKEYLNLQYKITRHKFSGERPPDGLIEAISNIERKVRLISRALK